MPMFHSNLPSPACADGLWGLVSAVKVVGIYLNGRRILAHMTISLPARGLIHVRFEHHIPLFQDNLPNSISYGISIRRHTPELSRSSRSVLNRLRAAGSCRGTMCARSRCTKTAHRPEQRTLPSAGIYMSQQRCDAARSACARTRVLALLHAGHELGMRAAKAEALSRLALAPAPPASQLEPAPEDWWLAVDVASNLDHHSHFAGSNCEAGGARASASREHAHSAAACVPRSRPVRSGSAARVRMQARAATSRHRQEGYESRCGKSHEVRQLLLCAGGCGAARTQVVPWLRVCLLVCNYVPVDRCILTYVYIMKP